MIIDLRDDAHYLGVWYIRWEDEKGLHQFELVIYQPDQHHGSSVWVVEIEFMDVADGNAVNARKVAGLVNLPTDFIARAYADSLAHLILRGTRAKVYDCLSVNGDYRAFEAKVAEEQPTWLDYRRPGESGISAIQALETMVPEEERVTQEQMPAFMREFMDREWED